VWDPPLATHVEGLPVPDLHAQQPSADPVASVEDNRGVPRGDHVARGDEPGEAAPDDDHVRLDERQACHGQGPSWTC
jgi:hypothetical protein